MRKVLTVSVIIPVHNEEHHITACLDALAQQTVAPNEVIVVDNNCSDKTLEIARQYPFVRIIHEKTQGLTPTRNAGFNAAKGEILARLDADAVADKNWIKTIRSSFEDDAVWGITGLGAADVLPRVKLGKTVLWSWLYFKWSEAFYGSRVLWGANMAIRRSAWKKVRSEVCMDDSLVHEDQDLSILLLAHGGKLKCNNEMRITTGGQTYHYFPKLMEYTMRRWSTRKLHNQNGNRAKIPREFGLGWRARTYFLLLPFIFFYMVSFLFWPLDAVMRQLGRAATWLD